MMWPTAALCLLILTSNLLAEKPDDEALKNDAAKTAMVPFILDKSGTVHVVKESVKQLSNLHNGGAEGDPNSNEENTLFSKDLEFFRALLNHNIGGNEVISKISKKSDTLPNSETSSDMSHDVNENQNTDLKIYSTPLKVETMILINVVMELNNKNSSNTSSNLKRSSKDKPMDVTDVTGNEISHQEGKRSGSSEERFLAGDLQSETRRLVAGRYAPISEFPYTVSIGKDGVHTCTGSIITKYLIITSASCFWRSSRGRSTMKVRAGSTDCCSGGVLIAISEVMKHPKYDVDKDPDFDVAVLRLVSPIKFSHHAAPLELPPTAEAEPIFKDAWITGWGSKRKDGKIFGETTMEVVHVRYIKNAACAAAYKNITAVSPNFVCFRPMDDESGPCIADSGAPAVSDHYLWGVASYGLRGGCGELGFPAVFTSIASREILTFVKYMITKNNELLKNKE